MRGLHRRREAEQQSGQCGDGYGDDKHAQIDGDGCNPRHAVRQPRPKHLDTAVGERAADEPGPVDSSTLSIKRARAIRNRPAPSAAWMPISRARTVARLNMRFATFAHAMNRRRGPEKRDDRSEILVGQVLELHQGKVSIFYFIVFSDAPTDDESVAVVDAV
jgi:hypothetical protein